MTIYLSIGFILAAIETYVSIYRGSSIPVILYCFFANLFFWPIIQLVGFVFGFRRRSLILKERKRLIAEMKGNRK